MLADVLSRDGAEQSASAIRQRNLANADHLAILHAIWIAETQIARHDRYRDLVTAALPPGHRQPLSHQARWLYRTLHAAELAGLDPADVIRTAIASRDLAGSRDVAAVLDARIRPRIDPLVPQPHGPWTRRIPNLPDPSRRTYLTQIAAMMDDRTQRLGQHTAQTIPAWAIQALGPVPADPADRQDWARKAASIAAYREMYGYDHPGDPIGPEPSHQAPDQRAAWHQGFAAFSPASQPDVRAMPDGRLWLLRDSYTAQTAWAPRHVGKELRLSQLGAFDAALGVVRADAEADAARKTGDHDRAARHEHLAASYRALRDHYQQQQRDFAQAMTERQEWEQATAGSRRLAIAADTELRRRHPHQKIEPLRSGEPAAVSHTGREQLPPGPDEKLTERVTRIRDLAAQRQASHAEMDEHPGRIVPGEDPAWASSAMPFLALGRLALMRSCSRPDRRSSPRRGSYSSPPSTTPNPTAKPRTDQTDAMRRNRQRATRKRRNRHSYKSAITAISSPYVTSSELQLARTITELPSMEAGPRSGATQLETRRTSNSARCSLIHERLPASTSWRWASCRSRNPGRVRKPAS